jgi:hypothetical protein
MSASFSRFCRKPLHEHLQIPETARTTFEWQPNKTRETKSRFFLQRDNPVADGHSVEIAYRPRFNNRFFELPNSSAGACRVTRHASQGRMQICLARASTAPGPAHDCPGSLEAGSLHCACQKCKKRANLQSSQSAQAETRLFKMVDIGTQCASAAKSKSHRSLIKRQHENPI